MVHKNLTIDSNHFELVHIIHRKAEDEHISFFLDQLNIWIIL
jgi:hypothetical protein